MTIRSARHPRVECERPFCSPPMTASAKRERRQWVKHRHFTPTGRGQNRSITSNAWVSTKQTWNDLDPRTRSRRNRPCHSVRKFQFPLNRLEARLFAQGVHKRVGLQELEPRVT